MNIEQIAEVLEEISVQEKNWYGIGSKLREITQEIKDESLLFFVFAFNYMFVESTNVEHFERYGGFAPIIEMEGKVFPPPPLSLSEDVYSTWELILQYIKHPLLVSRITNLLWEKKWGPRPDIYAKQAIDSYLHLIDNNLVILEVADSIIRALSISLSIRDDERIDKCISSIIMLCENEFSQIEKRNGNSFRLLKTLLDLPKNKIPDCIDELLEKSHNFHIDDPWLTQTNIELMYKRVGDERKLELQKYLVDRWISEANKSSGIKKIFHLERALELARNYGFNHIADQLRQELQNIPDTELDLHEISVTTEIPTYKIEQFISHFTEVDKLEHGLIKLGSHGPPSGAYSDNVEFVENLSRESPVQFLVTQQVFDINNIPIKVGVTFEENKQIKVIQHETMGIQLFSLYGYEILERLNKKFSFDNHESLVSFFTTPLITQDISENIINAIQNYLKGFYYISSLLLIPSIESIFRNIAREVGVPIIREPIGKTPGRVRGLGDLLHDLYGKMDEDWRRYFINALTDSLGLNYRNRICHGLYMLPEKHDVFVLIHIVCNLRLMEIKRNNSNSEDLNA